MATYIRQPDTSTVVQPVLTDLITSGQLLFAKLHYNTKDPYAVRLAFPSLPISDWVFARDLLAAGLQSPAGVGDVRLEPRHDTVHISLTSPQGHAVLAVDVDDVIEFLIATEELVEYHQETVDVDDVIARLAYHEHRSGCWCEPQYRGGTWWHNPPGEHLFEAADGDDIDPHGEAEEDHR
jgi:hypothetical protein